MANFYTYFKCDNCPEGVVKKTVRSTKSTLEIKYGDCNKCKKSFGLKSIDSLTKIDPPAK